MMNKILLIDDCKIEYELLKNDFSDNLEIDINYAHNLGFAKELLKSTSFDIIIIDVNLGNDNGYEVRNALQDVNSIFVITSNLFNEQAGVVLDGNTMVVSKSRLVQELKNITDGYAKWKLTDLETIKKEH